MTPYDFDVQKRPLPRLEDSRTWFYIIVGTVIIILIIIFLKL